MRLGVRQRTIWLELGVDGGYANRVINGKDLSRGRKATLIRRYVAKLLKLPVHVVFPELAQTAPRKKAIA